MKTYAGGRRLPQIGIEHNGMAPTCSMGRPLEQLPLTHPQIYLETYLLPYPMYHFSPIAPLEIHNCIARISLNSRMALES